MNRALHNLPASTDLFIGRDRELSALNSRLPHARLITLTGMSGIGKTRLALEFARQFTHSPTQRRSFPDGVWFVPLDALTDVHQVAPAIGATLGLEWHGDSDPLQTLTAYLSSRRLLLLLATAERLVERGLRASLRQLLSAAPLF